MLVSVGAASGPISLYHQGLKPFLVFPRTATTISHTRKDDVGFSVWLFVEIVWRGYTE